MPFIASKVLTPSSLASKTNSPSGILPGLMRADIVRRGRVLWDALRRHSFGFNLLR